MTNESLVVSIPEFAKLTGISRGLAYRLARQGELPVKTIALGRRLVLSRRAVEALLNGIPHSPQESGGGGGK